MQAFFRLKTKLYNDKIMRNSTNSTNVKNKNVVY